jgi:hypothetical protein
MAHDYVCSSILSLAGLSPESWAKWKLQKVYQKLGQVLLFEDQLVVLCHNFLLLVLGHERKLHLFPSISVYVYVSKETLSYLTKVLWTKLSDALSLLRCWWLIFQIWPQRKGACPSSFHPSRASYRIDEARILHLYSRFGGHGISRDSLSW